MTARQGRWMAAAVGMLLAPMAAWAQEPAAAAPETPAAAAPEAAAEASPSFVMPEMVTAAGVAEPTHPTNCPFCNMKDSITKAAPWLKLGADFRFRTHYAQNITSLQNHQTWQFERYRERVWWSVSPCQDLSFNFRLTFEPFYYDHPTDKPHPDWNEAIFDEMNIEWKKALGLPMTLKVGRQDINLGDKWLIYDGTPSDGSRTFYFDAVRATFNCAESCKTTLDLVYINQRADTSDRIKPFNDQDLNVSEANSHGVIVYGSNKSIKDTTIEPYFIYKHDEFVGKDQWADIYTFGTRVVRTFGEHWVASGELAKQFGHKQGRTLDSLGFNGRATYKFNDRNENQVYAGYEFDSGDKPGTGGRDEGFDRLWGRNTEWSDMYNGYIDSLEGPKAMSTNLHRISMGWQMSFADPCNIATVKNPYTVVVENNVLFADENNTYIKGISPSGSKTGFSSEGNFRGLLPRLQLLYKYNEHISGQYLAEFYFPGDFYTDARNDTAFFLRYMLVVTW